MSECNVSGCYNENNGTWVCDKHEWVNELEMQFDNVMHEVRKSNFVLAMADLCQAEIILRKHLEDD